MINVLNDKAGIRGITVEKTSGVASGKKQRPIALELG